MSARVHELQSQLVASDARGQATSNDNKRLLKEKQVLEDKVNNLESTLASAGQEIEARSQKYVALRLQGRRVLYFSLGCNKPACIVRYCHSFRHPHCLYPTALIMNHVSHPDP